MHSNLFTHIHTRAHAYISTNTAGMSSFPHAIIADLSHHGAAAFGLVRSGGQALEIAQPLLGLQAHANLISHQRRVRAQA